MPARCRPILDRIGLSPPHLSHAVLLAQLEFRMREANVPVDKALFSMAVRATRGGFGSYSILVQAPPQILPLSSECGTYEAVKTRFWP